jgi:hypothetical protein
MRYFITKKMEPCGLQIAGIGIYLQDAIIILHSW